MSEEGIVWVDFDTMERFMVDVLVKVDVPKEDAKIIADVLIKADKLGIDSHGMNRLKPIYVDRIQAGIVNPVTKMEVVRESPATAVIDGHNGMGHVISKKAMEMAIDRAKKYGLGMTAVRNSSHYGIAGYYPLMAVDEGMIGITGTNARPSIAPTFGVENMLGTNPLTFAMPTDEEFPFFLDCATSVSQRGKIEVYAKLGREMPQGWVVRQDGTTSTDPNQVLKDLVAGTAALVPVGGIGEDTGGYKGYGYATVVEILSAALQGGGFMKMLTGLDESGKKRPYNLGHFFMAINVEHFIEPSEFRNISGEILRQLRNSKLMPGAEKIYTPGEKEWIAWNERKEKGVPLNSELQKEVKTLIRELGVEGYDFPF